MIELLHDALDSPIGRVFVVSDGNAVRAVDFEGNEARLHGLLVRHYGAYTLRAARDAGGLTGRLRAYFEGDVSAIEGVPTTTGGTDFSRRVWAALREIPAGTTATYRDIAVALGRPRACRAVGMANGTNPISIVVPCHRVVGSDSTLTGYGGGLERKRWLLAHEGAMVERPAGVGRVQAWSRTLHEQTRVRNGGLFDQKPTPPGALERCDEGPTPMQWCGVSRRA